MSSRSKINYDDGIDPKTKQQLVGLSYVAASQFMPKHFKPLDDWGREVVSMGCETLLNCGHRIPSE